MKRKISTEKLCLLGIFTAITVILGIYATFRIGNQIKVPLKFITVFMTGAIFGPLWGGLVGAFADIMNAVIVPVGPPMPQITAVEFLYGFIYGVTFYRAKNNGFYYIRTAVCCVLQFVISMTLMSKILTDIGYFVTVSAAMAIRLPVAVVTLVLNAVVLCAMKKIIFRLRDAKEDI